MPLAEVSIVMKKSRRKTNRTIRTKSNNSPPPQSRIDRIHKIIGIAAAILTIVTTIGIYIYATLNKGPDIDVSLRLRYEGYYLTIANSGNEQLKDNYVRVVFWRHGSPAPDFESYEQIKDLPPKTDYSLRINFWEEATKHGHDKSKDLHAFGYVVASSGNIQKPKAMAFHVCYEGPSDEGGRCNYADGVVPLASFDYPEDAPSIGEAINYPDKYNESGWFPSRTKVERHNNPFNRTRN
jgi:hypothetical protein